MRRAEPAQAPAHHGAGGRFVNVYGAPRRVPWARYIAWWWRYLRGPRPAHAVPWGALVRASVPLGEGAASVTWLGHAGVHVRTRGADVLIDPLLPVPAGGRVARAGALERAMPRLEHARVIVVISHDHFDHLDRRSVAHLCARHACTFVVPLGVDARLRRWTRARCCVLDWWQSHTFDDGLRLTCCPANHWSGRGLGDRNATLWASWRVDVAPGVALYHGGDTGAGAHFAQIAARLGGAELCALPIAAYAPDWLHAAIHMNPEEALDALDALGGRRLLPLHWGTLDMSDEPLHEPIERLLRAANARGARERVLARAPGYG